MAMDGKVLRQGTNGWACVPDGPSPGVDPMCVDKGGMAWVFLASHGTLYRPCALKVLCPQRQSRSREMLEMFIAEARAAGATRLAIATRQRTEAAR